MVREQRRPKPYLDYQNLRSIRQPSTQRYSTGVCFCNGCVLASPAIRASRVGFEDSSQREWHKKAQVPVIDVEFDDIKLLNVVPSALH